MCIMIICIAFGISILILNSNFALIFKFFLESLASYIDSSCQNEAGYFYEVDQIYR